MKIRIGEVSLDTIAHHPTPREWMPVSALHWRTSDGKSIKRYSGRDWWLAFDAGSRKPLTEPCGFPVLFENPWSAVKALGTELTKFDKSMQKKYIDGKKRLEKEKQNHG